MSINMWHFVIFYNQIQGQDVQVFYLLRLFYIKVSFPK